MIKYVVCVMTCRSCGTVMSTGGPVLDTREEKERLLRDAPNNGAYDSFRLGQQTIVCRTACDAKVACKDRFAGYKFTWKQMTDELEDKNVDEALKFAIENQTYQHIEEGGQPEDQVLWWLELLAREVKRRRLND